MGRQDLTDLDLMPEPWEWAIGAHLRSCVDLGEFEAEITRLGYIATDEQKRRLRTIRHVDIISVSADRAEEAHNLQSHYMYYMDTLGGIETNDGQIAARAYRSLIRQTDDLNRRIAKLESFLQNAAPQHD